MEEVVNSKATETKKAPKKEPPKRVTVLKKLDSDSAKLLQNLKKFGDYTVDKFSPDLLSKMGLHHK